MYCIQKHKKRRAIRAISRIMIFAMLLSITETAFAADLIHSADPPAADSQSAMMVNEETSCPTYEEAYDRMFALKKEYQEGMPWTNFTPYGRDGDSPDYRWNGGKIKG